MKKFLKERWAAFWVALTLSISFTAACVGEGLPPGAATGAGAGTGVSGLGSGPAPLSMPTISATVGGTASNFVILAKTGISNVPTSAITGNMGVSPISFTALTGFSLTVDGSGVFSTSAQVTGKVYASDYAVPTPTDLTTSVLEMQTAYTDAAGRAPDYTELGAGNIGGMNLGPATYKWGTGVLIPTNVTLTGGANDVWIFQIAQDLTVSAGAQVILAGGALAKNVYWQIAGGTGVSIGTTAHVEGIIMTAKAITINTGASVLGRLLAQTAVTLDQNVVTQP